MTPNPLAGCTLPMVGDEEADLDRLDAFSPGESSDPPVRTSEMHEEAGGPPLLVDGGRLLRVLSSPVGDALKFRSAGGSAHFVIPCPGGAPAGLA